MLEWITGIGGLVIGIAGIAFGEYRVRAARRHVALDRIHQRNRSQLDEFYAPLLGKLERIRSIGVARQDFGEAIRDASLRPPRDDTEHSVAFNNRILEDELLPLYREIAVLFEEKRGLVEPSTAELQPALVAFLDLWARDSEARVSFETLQELEKRGVARDPQSLLYADAKHHVDCLVGLLNPPD